MLQNGYTTFIWDKRGCGNSSGKFDYNQTLQNSAEEAIAAINALQKNGVPGAENIGLWGISRAGWINPLIIQQYGKVRFWISVSGVDDKESFGYLLEQNLSLSLPSDSVKIIVDEWYNGMKITHSGASFKTYKAATENLNHNPFWLRFTNGGSNRIGYYLYQKKLMKQKVDPISGLQIYVPKFDRILAEIDCPVLALFGEKDKHVDWKKTMLLYQNTIPKLDIKVFPDCNHNMFVAETGGYYEFQDNNLPWNRCDDYLGTIDRWLNQLE
jgi:pimeloyl-ACP methyl ester carboxylesterase